MAVTYNYDYNIEEQDNEETWDFATVQSPFVHDKKFDEYIDKVEEYWDAILFLINTVAGYYRAQGYTHIGGNASVSFWENKMAEAVAEVREKSPTHDNVPLGQLGVLKGAEKDFRKKAEENKDWCRYVSPEDFLK